MNKRAILLDLVGLSSEQLKNWRLIMDHAIPARDAADYHWWALGMKDGIYVKRITNVTLCSDGETVIVDNGMFIEGDHPVFLFDENIDDEITGEKRAQILRSYISKKMDRVEGWHNDLINIPKMIAEEEAEIVRMEAELRELEAGLNDGE